jgi:hypothetical protein
MPKSILIAPWSDKDGKPHAAGEEVDLSDEEYQALRLDGKVANVDQPYAGEPGHYGDRTTRPAGAEDPSVEPPEPPRQQPQQQAPKKR